MELPAIEKTDLAGNILYFNAVNSVLGFYDTGYIDLFSTPGGSLLVSIGGFILVSVKV